MKNCREESLQQKREMFLRMINFVHEKFGVYAFTSSARRDEPGKINPVLFEAIAVAVDSYLDGKTIDVAHDVDLWVRKASLLMNDEFMKAAKIHTTKIDNILMRIDWARRILFPEV